MGIPCWVGRALTAGLWSWYLRAEIKAQTPTLVCCSSWMPWDALDTAAVSEK